MLWRRRTGFHQQYISQAGDIGTISGTAHGEAVPLHHAARLVLVKSIRGAGGGYRLAKDAAEVSVGDVLRALEGDLEPATCAALHSEDSCEIQGSCITKYVWKKVNESMAQTVDSIMINTLVEMNKEIKKEGQKDE